MNATSKPLALLDWDGTLRPGILLLDWAAFLAEAGFIGATPLAAMLELAAEYRAGSIPYDAFVVRVVADFAASLTGAPAGAVRSAAGNFVDEDSSRLFPISRPLIAFLKECDLEPVLISGSPAEPLSEYALRLGIGSIFTTELEVMDERYSGRVVRNMADPPTKEAAVRSLAGRSIAFGIGDRSADAPLVNSARLGAFAATDGAEPPSVFRADAVRLSVSAARDQVEEALAGLRSRADA